MAKLQNIKAVREMVEGTHKMQTRTVIGYEKKQDNIIREVGDVWEEKDATGKTVCWWTQMEGWRLRSTVDPEVRKTLSEVNDYVRSFPNCRKEVCTCKNPTSLDEKFRKRAGMCGDCVISYETELKIKGKFNEYALNKMKANAENFFQNADKEVNALKESLDKPITFLENSYGAVETWSSDNVSAIKEQIDNQYNTYKKLVTDKLNEIENDIK